MRTRDRSGHSDGDAAVAPKAATPRRRTASAAADGQMVADLVVVHAGELVTVHDGRPGPRTGSRLQDLGVIEGGAVACGNGRVLAVGPTDTVLQNVRLAPDAQVINAHGRVVMPGFVDSHTHFSYVGGREHEYEMRLQGVTYTEIARQGGGINYSVRAVREASEEQLLDATRDHMDAMLVAGTTTAEGKSGYGLYLEQEMRQLQAMEDIAKSHPLSVVPTFLAHEIPVEERPATKRRAYVRMIVDTMLPAVASTGLARYCDVFCERGVFTVAESRQILTAAKALGFQLKVHADELAASGGAKLAAELGATTADHLCRITTSGITALRDAKVMPVLLPGTSFMVGLPPAPARRMVDNGLPIVIASDYNPGTNLCESMAMAIAFGCSLYKLTPAEAIVAATINAGYALGLGGEVGTLAPGAHADLLLLDMETYRHLPYHYGVSHVDTVIKSGKVVVEHGARVMAA